MGIENRVSNIGKWELLQTSGKKWCRWRNSKENFIKWAEGRKWREWVTPASSGTVASKRQRNKAAGEEMQDSLGRLVCFYMLCPCRYWRTFVCSWKQSSEREKLMLQEQSSWGAESRGGDPVLKWRVWPYIGTKTVHLLQENAELMVIGAGWLRGLMWNNKLSFNCFTVLQ